MSEPNMLTHLAAANVQTSTYLRAWYQLRAKEAVGRRCCENPQCPSPGRLALWLERRAVPWEA